MIRFFLLSTCLLFSACDINLPDWASADDVQRGGEAEATLPGMERNFDDHHQQRHAHHHEIRTFGSSSDPYNWFAAWESIREREFPAIDANWTELNPNPTPTDQRTSGRILSVEFDPVDGSRIWIGTASGGLWVTDPAQFTWTPLMDSLPPLGISAIAINPLDTDKLIAGMDTITVNFTSIPSIPDAGVFTTSDAGETWNTMGANLLLGSDATFHGDIPPLQVNDLTWHPTDTNKVFMAANTGLWLRPAFNEEWVPADEADESMLPDKKAQSVWIDPDNTQQITVAFFNHGVFRSTDEGQTWTLLDDGAPSSDEYRLQSMWQSQGAYFASYLNRSLNETRIMRLLADDTSWDQFYQENARYTQFTVSPIDSTLMYLGGVNLYRLDTRQKRAIKQSGLHVDQHGVGYHPTDKNALLAINDGGAYVPVNEDPTSNGWQAKNRGLHNLQLYSVGQTTLDSTILLLNAQDQGVQIRQPDMTWKSILQGDGMGTMLQTDNPDTSFVFSVEACGQIYQYVYLNQGPFNLQWGGGTGDFLKGIADLNRFSNPSRCSQMPRAFWKPPYAYDPANGNFMYLAMIDGVYRSENRAKSWTMAAPIDSVSLITVDPSSPTDVYAYKLPNGSLHHSADRGVTWDSVATQLFPSARALAADPEQAGVLYMGRVSASDQLFRSNDKGQSWTNITDNMDDLDIPVQSVTVTPRLPDGQKYVFVGTDLGLFVGDADADAPQWYFVHGSIPYAMVMDIQYNPVDNSVRVATFGRGAWQLDTGSITLPSLTS